MTVQHALRLAMLLIADTTSASSPWQLGVGYDTSRGDYGASQPTHLSATVMQARYDTGRWSWRASLPYLQINGPADTTLIREGIGTLPASTGTRHLAGWGDAVVGSSYLAWTSGDQRWFVDVGGRLKLPTASRASGLGTGRPDATLTAQLYRQQGTVTALAGIGYKWVGKPDPASYRDTAQASAGLNWQWSPGRSLGAMVDVRQSTWTGTPMQRELTLYLSERLTPHWLLQGYVYTGTTDSSPHLGGGMALWYRFD